LSGPLFDRATIERALAALDEELRSRRVRADIHLVGGAAMLLAYGERPATRDLDGTWEPDTPVREAAWAVAARLGLPRSWLNNQVSVYMSARAAPGRTVYHGTHLRVMVTPAEHLLAMKVMASRPASDADDIRTLIEVLGIKTRTAVLDLVHEHFPDDPAPARALDLLEDIVSDVEPGGGAPTSASGMAPRATRQPAPRCARPMKRVRGRCSRPRGHNGPCRR
jgi:hypothetical protein